MIHLAIIDFSFFLKDDIYFFCILICRSLSTLIFNIERSQNDEFVFSRGEQTFTAWSFDFLSNVLERFIENQVFHAVNVLIITVLAKITQFFEKN